MNYYQFHIADWALHTSHLTLEEEAVYRRLLDFYYDSESPIPEETGLVIRRLRLRGHEDLVAEILKEFFVLCDDGWRNKRADREIEAYQQKAEQARTNGKRGGRPKKNSGLGENKETDNQEKTQPVISGLPEKSGSKANQEPRTKNQYIKPSTSEAGASDGSVTDKPPALPRHDADDMALAQGMFSAVLRVAPKTKHPDLTKWAETIRLMRERDSLTHAEIATVFRFANADPFWSANILSPTKLREKFATLDAKMRGEINGKSPKPGWPHENSRRLSGAERTRLARDQLRQERERREVDYQYSG